MYNICYQDSIVKKGEINLQKNIGNKCKAIREIYVYTDQIRKNTNSNN